MLEAHNFFLLFGVKKRRDFIMVGLQNEKVYIPKWKLVVTTGLCCCVDMF